MIGGWTLVAVGMWLYGQFGLWFEQRPDLGGRGRHIMARIPRSHRVEPIRDRAAYAAALLGIATAGLQAWRGVQSSTTIGWRQPPC